MIQFPEIKRLVFKLCSVYKAYLLFSTSDIIKITEKMFSC